MKSIRPFSVKLSTLLIAFSCATLASFAQVAHIKDAPDGKEPLSPEKTVKLSFSVSNLPEGSYLVGATCNYSQGNETRFNPEALSAGPSVPIELQPDKGDKLTVSGSGKVPANIPAGEYRLRACSLRFNSERLKNDGEPDFFRPVRFDPPLTIQVKK